MKSLPSLDYTLCKIPEKRISEVPTTYKRLISSGGYLLWGSLCSPGWCIRCSISRRCSIYTSRESLAVICQWNINTVTVPLSSTLFNSRCAVSYLYFYVQSTGIKDSWINKKTYILPEHMGGCEHCAVYFIVCNVLYIHTVYFILFFQHSLH
jgi:hypothetical protein